MLKMAWLTCEQMGIWRQCFVASGGEDARQADRWGLILAGCATRSSRRATGARGEMERLA
jgi:hypothetical protein